MFDVAFYFEMLRYASSSRIVVFVLPASPFLGINIVMFLPENGTGPVSMHESLTCFLRRFDLLQYDVGHGGVSSRRGPVQGIPAVGVCL